MEEVVRVRCSHGEWNGASAGRLYAREEAEATRARIWVMCILGTGDAVTLYGGNYLVEDNRRRHGTFYGGIEGCEVAKNIQLTLFDIFYVLYT